MGADVLAGCGHAYERAKWLPGLDSKPATTITVAIAIPNSLTGFAFPLVRHEISRFYRKSREIVDFRRRVGTFKPFEV